ncbi:sodium-dependent transporter [Rhodothermaceae bacterium RA]|nr:sodium-dependent transporter [Rhodothermaceae bacterium RA]
MDATPTTSTRGSWNSKIGFILAAAGSAVGLGNIWKFPFEVADGGGGAFVLIYLVCCFLLCFPVMVTEIAIGRRAHKNAVGAFEALGFRNWRFVGLLGVTSGVLILSFYNVVAAWALGYFVELAGGHFSIGSEFGTFITDVVKIGLYAALFMVMTAGIVSGGISSGIERASKLLMPALLVIILGLVLYGLTLPHAAEGLRFYLIPDFSEVTLEVVYNALGQAFFSLSLGMGALITYGSYLSKRENIIESAALITLTDVGIAFTAGLLMFPLVAFLNAGDMTDVQGGAGLIFVTLPGAFESMGPGLGAFVGATFFLLLSFAALTSTVSLLEVPTSFVIDEFNVPRRRAAIGIAVLVFLIGIPSLLSNGASPFFTNFVTYFGSDTPNTFMDLVEHLSSDTFLPLGGFLIVVFAAYVWKTENLSEELAQGAPGFRGSALERFIHVCVAYVCPVLLGIIFVLTVLNRFFGVSVF